MPAKATVVVDTKGNSVPVYEVLLDNQVGLCNGNPQGYFLYNNLPAGPTYVRILASGYAAAVYPITLDDQNQEIHLGGDPNSGPPNTIHLPALSFNNAPLWRPSKEQIENFRGAFCVPDAFDYIKYGDNHRIWTPATLAYPPEQWQSIINRYKQLHPNYTHYVINLGGSTYHNDYPHIDDNPAKARELIILLLNNHLIPVCCATDDENPDFVLNSYLENADIIDCSFVMWEMNGPCHDDSDRMFHITSLVRSACEYASTFLHFTAGHGSMDEPENVWWIKCAEIGIRGLFSQDDHWDNRGITAAGLEDTAKHLRGEVPGWEPLKLYNMLNIAFEQTTTPVYHLYNNWRGEAPQLDFGDFIVRNCPNIAGYMDGTRL